MTTGLQYRRLRAPAGHGEVFCEPTGEALAKMLAENARLRAEQDTQFGDCSLKSLATSARQDLIDTAVQYHSQYSDIEWVQSRDADQIILAGHQPEIFHPGVWLKNFVLSALAAKHGCIAINLLIDNDECRRAAIDVPRLDGKTASLLEIPLDAQHAPLPWEQREVIDADVLDSFGESVGGDLALEFGQELAAARLQTANLGECLARARHKIETKWGATSLEVPLSRVCNSPAFHGFAAHLLNELPRLTTIYNDALAEYRKVHRLRSPAQPLPDLAATDERVEAPFWIWTEDSPQRKPLFLHRHGDQLALNAVDDPRTALPLPTTGELLGDFVQTHGIRLRPRALLTTMFARLLLGDLFIHGIGGAKYDQIADRIIERFFNLTPLGFMTVSGTWLLPQAVHAEPADDPGEIDRQLRQWEHHPEASDLSGLTEDERRRVTELADRKHRLIRDNSLPPKQKHEDLADLNHRLRQLTTRRQTELLTAREAAEKAQHAQRIFGSREFAFCIHPAVPLREWLLDSAAKAV